MRRALLGSVLALLSLAALTGLVACGGGDGSGGTGPIGPSLSLAKISGDGQNAPPGGELSDPLVVSVLVDGQAAAGRQVEWELTATAGPGAELLELETTTDSTGRASARLRVGEEPGEYRVGVSTVEGDASVTFSASAEAPRPASLRKAAGDGQTGMVGTALPDSLAVEVGDQFGDPLPGVEVRFEVTRGERGDPEVSPSAAETDSEGRARARLVLGDLNGTYQVAARTDESEVTFTAEATGGDAALVSLSEVRPERLEAGEPASVLGSGFSSEPGENEVRVDGRRAEVLTATSDSLEIRVPTFEDRCLPRRRVDVRVAVGPDTTDAVRPELEPAVPTLDLAVGQDTVLEGPDEVGCALLSAATGGEAYQVTAAPVPDALGFNSMRIFVNGGEPVAETAGARENRAAAADRPIHRFRRDERDRDGRTGGDLERLGPVPGVNVPQIRLDRRLREMERGMLGRIRARAARAPGMSRTIGDVRPAEVAAEGDTARFVVSCVGDSSIAVARSVSEAAVVYEDTTIADVGFTDVQYDSIAANFDTLLFATDTTYFGAPADVDGNGRVLVLFSDAVNSLTTGSYEDGFVVGFFCPVDLAGGNEGEMFYLVSPDPDGEFNGGGGSLPAERVRQVIDGTVIHEFQHLINAQVGGGTSPTVNNRSGVNEIWINEGLSHLAEEVGGHAATGNEPGTELTAGEVTRDQAAFSAFYFGNLANLSNYLQSPGDTAALLTASDPGIPNTFRMRGAAWSFVRYLLDRFESAETEASFTRALIQTNAASGRDAVEQVAGLPFEVLVADWAASLAVEGREGLPDRVRPSLSVPTWDFLDVYETLRDAGVFPLQPPTADMAGASAFEAELFTATARYVRLEASGGTAGTGVRLATPTGERLSPGLEPRLVIVRTQ